MTPVADPTPPVELPAQPEPEPKTEVEKHDESALKPGAKDRPAKGPFTFKQLVGDPSSHLGQVVSPADLVLVNTDTASPRNLSVRSGAGTYQALAKADSPFRMVLKQELAGQLREKISSNVLVGGEYPAVLQMKIEKDPGHSGGYIGVVEWLELLYYIDPRPITGEQRRYHLVYCVAHLGPNGASVGHSSSFKLWQERIQEITTNIRLHYKNNNKPAIVGEMGQLAISPNGNALRFHRWLKQHFPIQ